MLVFQRENRIREELLKTSVIPDNRFTFTVPCKLMRHWRVYRQDAIFPHHKERVDSVLLLGRRPDADDGENKAPVPPEHSALLSQCSIFDKFNTASQGLMKVLKIGHGE